MTVEVDTVSKDPDPGERHRYVPADGGLSLAADVLCDVCGLIGGSPLHSPVTP